MGRRGERASEAPGCRRLATHLMLWSARVSGSPPDGGPLANVRVVGFGQLIAGPLVGTLLGDFGADVIKVEPPTGDQMRDWGQVHHRGRTLWWSVLARNKRSVAL